MNIKNSLIIIVGLAFTCFALSPQARAVCQQGCDTINSNTFLGEDALINNTTGESNTAVGYHALLSNTIGEWNTALGYNALGTNTTGGLNTALGYNALENNTTGNSNIAVGTDVLEFNTSGGSNTAVGNSALEFNNTGNSNTATGQQALTNNSDGSNNAAFGMFALQLNTSGSNNTAIGFSALRGGSLLGDYNTALGSSALYRCKGSYNTAIGTDAGRNVFLGNNNICIRNLGASESNTIRIGNATHTNTFIAGISGTTVPTGVAVIVDGSGHLGTTTSSARFKEAIKPMDKASEAILALKPVTFRYKPEIDADGIPQFGLVAEDVEKVNPDLVARNDEGKPYTVRYEAVNAMLLNEFLKEHRKVEKLETTVEQQQKQIAALTSQMLQVNEQLRANKLPPQLVVDN